MATAMRGFKSSMSNSASGFLDFSILSNFGPLSFSSIIASCSSRSTLPRTPMRANDSHHFDVSSGSIVRIFSGSPPCSSCLACAARSCASFCSRVGGAGGALAETSSAASSTAMVTATMVAAEVTASLSSTGSAGACAVAAGATACGRPPPSSGQVTRSALPSLHGSAKASDTASVRGSSGRASCGRASSAPGSSGGACLATASSSGASLFS
mmetsp:Transcript_163569/g.314124  ORF Transcript_163569/g.314124 Transcript_163569/m.314124 type:complete len:212 (+) Transcript_163569:744-1379(+)